MSYWLEMLYVGNSGGYFLFWMCGGYCVDLLEFVFVVWINKLIFWFVLYIYMIFIFMCMCIFVFIVFVDFVMDLEVVLIMMFFKVIFVVYVVYVFFCFCYYVD